VGRGLGVRLWRRDAEKKKKKKEEEEGNEPTDQLALGRHEWLSSAADA
jgi:hypothetical protein